MVEPAGNSSSSRDGIATEQEPAAVKPTPTDQAASCEAAQIAEAAAFSSFSPKQEPALVAVGSERGGVARPAPRSGPTGAEPTAAGACPKLVSCRRLSEFCSGAGAEPGLVVGWCSGLVNSRVRNPA